MEQFTVSNIRIDIVRKDIKNIHLAVYPPNGRVRIAVPTHLKDSTIRLFAASKIGWIKKHKRKFSEQEREAKREYVTRESHYFQGQRYLLRVIETNGRPRVEINSKTYIDLFVNPEAAKRKKNVILNEWYRAELKKLIPLYIKQWQNTMGVHVEDWGVKQMRTKWGSCNIKSKRIWINLELAKKPLLCLEYVIVHEMIHLLERHHNDRFQYYLNKFMPKWKAYRNELNRLPVSHKDWEY